MQPYHLRKNVKDELFRRKFSDTIVSDIAGDIFGKQVGTTYFEGLVDAENEDVFYKKLEEMRKLWEAKEKESSDCIPGFYPWFCEHKVDSIVSGMLKPVREEAGLGSPPSSFTTNANESLNAMLKRKVDFKKNELPNFVNNLKELIDEQERELERAIIGRGKYQIREEYNFLKMKEEDWFRMSREQREKHLHRFSQVKLVADATHLGVDVMLPVQLSVTAEEFHTGLQVPLDVVQNVWKKASELILDSNGISSAPGYGPECKMVASRKGKRPHLVTRNKGGKFSCDNDCPNWKSIGFCSHSIAVAQVNGQLEEFCNILRKSKRLPSISQLVLTGLPAGLGNKGNRVNRKRKSEEASSRVSLTTPPIASSCSSLETTSSCNLPSLPGPSYDPVGRSVWTTLAPPPYTYGTVFQQHTTYNPSVHCSVNTGDMHMPTHYTMGTISPPYCVPQSGSPDSLVSTNEEFLICFRSGNISVCNGCRNKFDKQAKAPHDLCIKHQEWRLFTSPVSHQPDKRFSNAYYHCNPTCVLARWPYFVPSNSWLIVSDDVKQRLHEIHKEYIYIHFGVTI